MTKAWTTPVAWTLVFLLTVAVVMLFQTPKDNLAQRSYSQLIGMGPNLKFASIRGDLLEDRDEKGERFAVRLPHDVAFADRLVKDGTDVVVEDGSDNSAWLTTLLTNGLPLVFYAVVWLYPLLRIARALEGLLSGRAPTTSSPAMDAAPPSA